MIRTWRGLLLIAVLTFIIGLVVLFPARIAYQWAAPADASLSGIQGTVWRGSADAANMAGFVLRDVSWSSRPWYLLTGRALYRVDASPVAGFVEGALFVSIGSSIIVSGSDVRASLPLQMFASAFNVRGLQGNASLQLQRFEVRDGLPVVLDGIVNIDSLLLPDVGSTPIGGYRAEFFTQQDGISGSVEDTDGIVDIAGSLELKSDRNFRFIAKVMAKPSTPASLRSQLQRLPRVDDAGRRELRIEGSL
ncbi:MAG: type II secretion system protein N [Gammaproteobacteria bacterium]|nr:type II secretion system protein N [Gammaproteobacteria bacterium]